MIVKTVFLCDISIFRDFCLKLQKVDKGDGALHKKPKGGRHKIRVSATTINIIYDESKHRTEKWL